MARAAVKKEEPAIWDSVLSSPLARKYMVRSACLVSGWEGLARSGSTALLRCACIADQPHIPPSTTPQDDPMSAVKEVVAVTNEYANYWKDKQPINP